MEKKKATFSREERACIQAVCSELPKRGIVILHTKSRDVGYRIVFAVGDQLGCEVEVFPSWNSTIVNTSPMAEDQLLVIDAIGRTVSPDYMVQECQKVSRRWNGILILTDQFSEDAFHIPSVRKYPDTLKELYQLIERLPDSNSDDEWDIAVEFQDLAKQMEGKNQDAYAALAYAYAIRMLAECDDDVPMDNIRKLAISLADTVWRLVEDECNGE